MKHSLDRKKIIIIGGGTAGLVIANKLQSNFDVIVVEKSKYKKYLIWYRIPLLIGLLFKNEKTKYISKREHILSNGRRIPFFDSNLLGGASIMNGCVHVFGNKRQWSSILEKFNSNYEDLLESYNNLFSLRIEDKNKINLSEAFQNDISVDFAKSLNKQGVPCGDMNYSNKENCGPILNTIKRYFRTSVLTLIKKRKFKQHINENVVRKAINDYKSGNADFSDYLIVNNNQQSGCIKTYTFDKKLLQHGEASPL